MTEFASASAPRIVVVIPVRDRPLLVLRAVKSVATQLPPPAQVIVVDDGSEPPVEPESLIQGAHVEGAQVDVRLVRVPHGGVSSARNAGVAAADADWITFLDSDDEAAPGWLAAIAAAAAAGATLFSCAAEYRWDDGTSDVPVPAPMWPGAEGRALFLAGTFALPRTVFQEAGGYRAGLRHGENTDLGWRVAELVRASSGRTMSTDTPLVIVHARRTSVDPEVLLESARMSLLEPPTLLAEDRRSLATHCAIAGTAARRLGRRRGAISWMAKAMRADPRNLRHAARLVRAVVAKGER